MPQNILFFADRLPPLIGGMEMHASYFIKYFKKHPRFPISGVISKNIKSQNYNWLEENKDPLDLKAMQSKFNPGFVFFNSGRWIEESEEIRKIFPQAKFFYRTGGNEILKASLVHRQISNHRLRQSFWVRTLNNAIDFMITNSAYTETRLREVGITCPFLRCVGGVNSYALRPATLANHRPLTIFCAARFVPYKNHSLLLSLVHKLILRGNNIRLRLAGDGPLLVYAKEQVARNNLTSIVEFLGVLDNTETCHEIALADIYMQLSGDTLTQVPGGSYLHSEGMGRSILEAITAGTFVIAGRSGALSENVTEGRGILVELEHFTYLIEVTEKIVQRLPPRGLFLEAFKWENIFKRYKELFGKAYENINGHRKM